MSQSRSNEDDGTSTEAAWKIAEALGVRVDRCRGLVDSYGAEHALAALADVQRQIKAGKQLHSPIAVMIANLRSGAVQIEVAQEDDPDVERLRLRWHKEQSSPAIDTAQKRLARKLGDSTIACTCGCGESFSAEVRVG